MEPVTTALLLAVVGGVGGSAAQDAWASLRRLVQRPSRQDSVGASTDAVPGAAELDALEQRPADPQAEALAAVLRFRAVADAEFGRELAAWAESARRVHRVDGDTHIGISGGIQRGPVVQGRDFSGPLTFSTPPTDNRPDAGV